MPTVNGLGIQLGWKEVMSSPPTTTQPPGPPPALPALEPGDCLDQKTFHARYEAMPEDARAELIGGVVHMPSPLKRPHGRMHVRVIHWLSEYRLATPGTETYDNTTNILGPESEPQPDACLLIAPEKGGQTRVEDDYVFGPPELVVEVASATESIDLHAKKNDYEKAGVREYVVVVLRQAEVHWFVRRGGAFGELAPAPDGSLRSEVFPGLWLDPQALLRGDMSRVLEVLRAGLASPEHGAFVAHLAGQP
jgi:Uma2 family endonuclease